MDPNIYTKALKLLKKQGLVAKLEADCRHIVPTTSARPSRPPPPTFLEPVRTSTAASPEAPSLQHASNQSSRLPVPVLSEPASAAHSRRKYIANLQGSSDGSYSPLEFILSQHTLSESKSIAHASCKDTAGARRLSNRSKCPQDVARSEHTSPEHPRSNGDAGSQNRSDSSSSPTPKPTLSEHKSAARPKPKDEARSQSAFQSSFSKYSSSSPSLPEPALSESTSAVHSKSKNTTSFKNTAGRPSCSPEHTIFEHTSVAHSETRDGASAQSTPGQWSSLPAHEQTSAAHSISKDIVSTKSISERSFRHQAPFVSKDISVEDQISNCFAGAPSTSDRCPSLQVSTRSERTPVGYPIPKDAVSTKSKLSPIPPALFPR